MEIQLANGDMLRGDMIVSSVLRSDMVPVPMTLECTARYSPELEKQLSVGKTVTVSGTEMKIIQTSPSMGGAGAKQGDRELGQISFTALLASCAEVAFLRSKAVIKEGATMGAIYRACGAKVTIESDFVVNRFSCFAGGVPSYHIAIALQEESGALVWSMKDKRLRFKRLHDLFADKPSESLDATGVEWESSGFMERHEIPWFFSTDKAGAFVFGNRQKARAARYTPLKAEGTLKNMTRALVHCGTFQGRLDMSINAGDAVDVDGKTLAVVTAAHVYEAGGSGGAPESYSRLWLSRLEA